MENKEPQDKLPSPKSTPWDTLKNIPFNYDAKMQERVQKHKETLNNAFETNEYEHAPEPTKSNLIKAGRLLLATETMKNLFPHVFEKSEKKQELEAMHIAYGQHLEEQKRKQIELEEYIRKEAELEEQRKTEAEQRKTEAEQREKAKFEADFIDNMDTYRYRRDEGLKGERAQEIAERNFNEVMTDLGELDICAEIGESGISKRTIEHNGKQITVYDASGYPLSYLQHNIAYKGTGGSEDAYYSGSSTAKQLQDDPSVWTKNYEDKIATRGVDSTATTKSNTISTSYVNTETPNFMQAGMMNWDDGVFYGFNHLEPDSILQIFNGDGGTTNNIGRRHTFMHSHSITSPDKLSTPETSGTYSYNEVQIRRYGEHGEAKKPDFIITRFHGDNFNRGLDEISLKHAAFFDIPIINIDIKAYENNIEQNIYDSLSKISKDDDYPEIRKTIDTAASSMYRELRMDDLGLMSFDDICKENYSSLDSGKTEILKKASAIEIEKRTELLEDRLSREISQLKNAATTGNQYHPKINVEHIHYGEQWKGSAENALIFWEVKTKENDYHGPSFDTIIYDGEHLSPEGESRLQGYHQSSEAYNRLSGLVDEYLSLIQLARKQIS